MAEKKFLSYEGLEKYDELIKQKIASDDASTLSESKEYADSLGSNYDPAGTAQTKVQELANGQVATNKTDIANLKSGKADKATTLAGYGITDAYTKSQTDSAIATAIANADHLKREIVEDLPEAGSADEHTIYMVAKDSGSGDQNYDEYMLINGAFEKVGDSAVNLTNYATKAEVSTAKSEAISTAASDATSKANKALSDAKAYADGLADNYATAAQGAKADSALQKADITTGSANGSIAVKGTDVPVKGLASAAYKTAGTAQGNVPVNGASLGTTANVPVVTNASGQIVPHASGALKSAAFADTSAFDAAGTAQSKVDALSNGQVTTNKNNIATLQSKVATLESTSYVEITEEEIAGLFA